METDEGATAQVKFTRIGLMSDLGLYKTDICNHLCSNLVVKLLDKFLPFH